MLEHFKSEAQKISYIIDDEYYTPALSDSQKQNFAEMEEKLCHGLNLERLDRIQGNIMSLSESELTVQAVRLELAVHKLANRGFDRMAEEFCQKIQMQLEREQREEFRSRASDSDLNP